MTRLISSGRIGGRVTETLRCAPGIVIAAALAALFAVLAIGGVSSFAPIGSVFAQQAQSADFPEFSTYELFTGPNSLDLRPEVLQQLADAIRKAQAPGNCSLGRLKIRVPTGDPSFQDSLVKARRDAVLAALNRLGVPVAGRLFVETSVAGGPGGTDTVYESPLDKRPPKLDVIWTPEKGTKVEAGQRITAKATASDDPTQWQTGLKNIKLTVDGGDRPFGFQEYPQTCVPPLPPPQTLERFYIVPSPAPPMVRLRATAKDYAGNETEVWADFPTGDWYGTIKKTAKGGGHNHTIDIDYSFGIEPSGMIKGRARARIRTEEGQAGCTFLWTYSPSEFDIPLSGRRNGENFEITLEPGTTTATVRDNCTGSLRSTTFPSHINPAVAVQTKYRISAQDGATNTVERISGALPWGVVMGDTIQIHQARDNRVSYHLPNQLRLLRLTNESATMEGLRCPTPPRGSWP